MTNDWREKWIDDGFKYKINDWLIESPYYSLQEILDTNINLEFKTLTFVFPILTVRMMKCDISF